MCVHVDVNHSVPLIDKIYFHEQQYKSNILFEHIHHTYTYTKEKRLLKTLNHPLLL